MKIMPKKRRLFNFHFTT